MDKSDTAPCEACGGLLPLKPIQKSHSGKQLQNPLLQPNQEEPSQPEDASRRKDSHHSQTEPGATSHNENLRDLENSLPSSDYSDDETEGSNGKKRSYDSVLEEIQAIFAGQKVKKETISSYMHQYMQRERERERKSSQTKQHESSQTYLRVIRQHASTSKSGSPARARSPLDVNLPSLLQPYQRNYNFGPVWKRAAGQLPSDVASVSSFDPLRMSPSPRVHATQSCTHQLGEPSKRERIILGEATRCSTPPSSVSTKQKTHTTRHGTVDNQQEACRPTMKASAECNKQPRVDNDCYLDVLQPYEECHIHEIDEHITATLVTSPRGSRNLSRRHRYEERGFQTQPQQIIYSCHQHVSQQTVVRHHEGCHLHQRNDLKSPRALSPSPTDVTKCPRCGFAQQDGSLQRPADHCKTCYHQPPKAYVKTGRSSEQEVTACVQRLASCNMHGEGCQQRTDVCGVLHHQDLPRDLQTKSCEDRNFPICKHPCEDHNNLSPAKEKLHADSPRPKCQEPKDPLVWTPRRVWKPKQCAVRWLDRISASQNIPSHIVQQYRQGKRRCPPRWMRQKCLACVHVGKVRDGNVSSRDPCQREVTEPAWNSGSDIAESTVECKEWKERRGKHSRLALSRVLIVKPVPKVSTSQGLWTRKEFEVCSECRDLKLFRSVGITSGRWSSILETMSSTGLYEKGEMSSNCSTKFSCHTVHGLSVPDNTPAMDLRGPELNSAFRLRRKLQKLQNETFDRRAAMQVAQMEGIELDKEIFDLLPETKTSQKGSSRRTHQERRRKRLEVYRGLSKIVDFPMPPCQICAPREVGVQVYKRDSPPFGNPSDFCPEVQSSLQPATSNPTNCFNWPGQEHSNCRAPDQSLDEQHWAYLVEACRQVRMAQGNFGSCSACQ